MILQNEIGQIYGVNTDNRRICPMLCQECEKRNTCRELCKEAEAYVNQDHVRRRERLLDDNNIIPGNWPVPATSVTIIQLFFIDHKSVTEIAKSVGKSHQYVSKVIKQAKRTLQKNLQK